jgi:type IX secretion system PorP/SprF family membrane protein
MEKKIQFLALNLLFVTAFFGQDIQFSQFSESPVMVNPALAGVRYDTRLTANFRTQWGSVAKSYQTYGLSFEQAIKNKKLGKGYWAIYATMFREQAGDARMSTLLPSLGVNGIFRLNKKSKFSIGMGGGFVYRTIDVDNLRWDRQFDGYAYDPTKLSGESAPRSGYTSYDLSSGVNYSYAKSEKFISSKDGNKFDCGLAFNHFLQPRNSFFQSSERLYRRLNFYMNADINIPNSRNAVMPAFLFMRQGPSTQFMAGALFKFILVDQSIYTSNIKPVAFAFGAHYRYKDAIIPAVLFQYDKYAIGVSYDINVSALTPASRRNGGVEVMLRYNVSPGYGRNLGRSDTKSSY